MSDNQALFHCLVAGLFGLGVRQQTLNVDPSEYTGSWSIAGIPVSFRVQASRLNLDYVSCTGEPVLILEGKEGCKPAFSWLPPDRRSNYAEGSRFVLFLHSVMPRDILMFNERAQVMLNHAVRSVAQLLEAKPERICVEIVDTEVGVYALHRTSGKDFALIAVSRRETEKEAS